MASTTLNTANAIFEAIARGVQDTQCVLSNHPNAVRVRQSGLTPLHVAAAAADRSDAIAAILLDYGADIDAKGLDSNASTPLLTSLSWGNRNTAALLLARGAAVNLCDADGMTPLHFSAARGYTEIIRQLIDCGAKCNARSRQGWTPLHVAAQCAQATSVHTLLEPCREDLLAPLLEMRTADTGATPLALATALGHRETSAVLLCRFGADPDAVTNEMGRTPLHQVCASATSDPLGQCSSILVGILAKCGATLNRRDASGERALHLACKALGGADNAEGVGTVLQLLDSRFIGSFDSF